MRKGFTLVEMLVVIVILGILATLVSGVAVNAQRAARSAVIKTEVDQIAGAFKAYKIKYGEYPPNFTDVDAVKRHFRKAFPRMDSHDVTALDTLLTLEPQPDEAVVFWLGGFSDDPQHPLTGDGGPMGIASLRRSKPLLDVLGSKTYTTNPTPEQLAKQNIRPSRDPDSFPEMYLWNWRPKGMRVPYIYFNSSRGFTALTKPTFPDAAAPARPIEPFIDDDGKIVEPASFQILSAGLDDAWGDNFSGSTPYPQPSFPAGLSTSTKPQGGWLDNVVSFSTRTLGDSVP